MQIWDKLHWHQPCANPAGECYINFCDLAWRFSYDKYFETPSVFCNSSLQLCNKYNYTLYWENSSRLNLFQGNPKGTKCYKTYILYCLPCDLSVIVSLAGSKDDI